MNIPADLRAEIIACLNVASNAQTATPVPEYLMRFWSVPEVRTSLRKEFKLSPEQEQQLDALHVKLTQSDPEFARGIATASHWAENFQAGIDPGTDPRQGNTQP